MTIGELIEIIDEINYLETKVEVTDHSYSVERSLLETLRSINILIEKKETEE